MRLAGVLLTGPHVLVVERESGSGVAQAKSLKAENLTPIQAGARMSMLLLMFGRSLVPARRRAEYC